MEAQNTRSPEIPCKAGRPRSIGDPRWRGVNGVDGQVATAQLHVRTYRELVTIPGHGLLIFDGDCGFCTSSALWVSRDWRPGPRTVAWQHLGPDGLRSLGLCVDDAKEAAWWVDDRGQLYKGHRAIAKSLLPCRGWKRVAGALLSVPPLSWCAAAVYPVVVRYRHRLPGGTPVCRAAPPDPHRSTGAE